MVLKSLLRINLIGRIMGDKKNNMLKYFFELILVGILLFGCEAKNNKQSIQLDKNIGIVHQNCLAIRNNQLKIGDKLKVIIADEKNTELNTTIMDKLENEKCIMLLEDRKIQNSNQGFTFYEVDLGKELVLSPSFAVLGNNFPSKMNAQNYLQIDLDGDDIFEFTHTCTSSEGLVFSLWSKLPYQSDKLWEMYYYLGYDLEPNCPDNYSSSKN